MKKFLLFAAALGCAFASKAADYTLPFSFTASEESLTQCTVIDVAENGETGYGGAVSGKWFYYGGTKKAFKYSYLMSAPADDWLILPAVDFGDCKKVKVSFQIETYSDKEDLAVCLGHEATAAGMTENVMTLTDFSKSSFTEMSAEVTVPDDGNTVWHLGFHATSPAFRGWIYLKDFKIESADGGVTLAAPAAPVVKSSTIRDLDYSAVVTMPSVDTDGQAIDGALDLRVLVDGTLTDTKTGCTPGADVDVNLTLLAGTHTISFVAVQGSAESAAATDNIEAKEHVAVPAKPVINSCTVNFLSLSASVTAPSLDTDGNELSGYVSLQCLVDGTVVDTKNYLSAGASVTFARTLTAGSHTVGFIAVCDGQKSEIASTEVEAKEQIFDLPFTMTASAETFAMCEKIDANYDGSEYGDNGKWVYKDDAFVYTYSSISSNGGDDWVILPKVDFGSVRKVKVSVSVSTGSYPEGLEVKLGSARTISAMTIPVLKKENYEHSGGYETLSATVELADGAPSVLCLGLHAISEADQFELKISEVKIESAEIPEIIPAVPVIKESTVKNLNYTAVVTMPAVDTEGNALTEAMSLEVLVDDVVVETKSDCAAGADVDVALTLAAGEHTVAYRAVLGENTGEAVSETVTATALSTGGLPFAFDATEANFGECEIIDIYGSVESGGNIKGSWQFATDGSFKYVYNPNSDADDWLILPFVDFAKCMKVKVSVDIKTEYDTESFEIFLGQERTVEGMTIPVLSKTGFTSKTWTTLTAEVNTPYGVARAANRLFALGIHATSPQNHYNMYFKNFRIEALVLSGIEEVEADEDAEPEYYNLHGIRVANPTHGIYIMRRGSVVSKVVL
ncbi:MAG: choice-of-anchor J domain-containing protein [Muribaculaceae bacterium]|nr:choice-of-anchor J domain-containing protein [Muribaculaceae bacterium]